MRLRLEEDSAAGALGLQLLQVRDAIHAAERDGIEAHVVEQLRARERELSSAVISTLAREGDLLSALVGRGSVAGDSSSPAPTRRIEK